MKKILLLATGGTIASAETEDGYAPAFTADGLIQRIPGIKNIARVEGKLLMNLDSSDVLPDHWQEMARYVHSVINKYDGFIITHGTDTMAYSSSALSFMLSGLNKPVVFTGSQLTFEEPHSDAPFNLYSAIRWAAAGHPGVVVVFNGLIIRGCRASKIRSKSLDAFDSINHPVLGRVDPESVELHSAPLALPMFSEPPVLKLKDELEKNVLLLKIAPGMSPTLLEESANLGYKGIVLEGFGVGGIPATLLPGLESLLKKNIPVVLTTQCLYEGVSLNRYEVGNRALSWGVIPAGDMTTEAALTKLMWILPQASDLREISSLMLRNLAGELTE